MIGLWSKGRKSSCAVELELPGGNIGIFSSFSISARQQFFFSQCSVYRLGRLHGCELDEDSLNADPVPVKKFALEKKGRMILVKVIGFSKIRQQALESPKLLRPTKVRPIKDGKVITKVRPPLRILVSFIYSLIFRFDSLIF